MEFAELIPTTKLDKVLLKTIQANSSSSTATTNPAVEGTLCLTSHHLIFSTRREDASELLVSTELSYRQQVGRNKHLPISEFPFQLFHRSIDYLERRPNIVNNVLQGGCLILKCKDLRQISIEIQSAREFLDVARSLETLSRFEDYTHYYPFFYRPMHNILEDGWTMYRPEMEYSKLLNGDEWRLSNVNSEYSVCQSYGAVLVVPKHISDVDIISSAVFRESGRFPVASYKHEATGAIMLRGSQPAANKPRCRADEAILNSVLGKSNKGFIVDTWGKSKSTPEQDQNYSQWKKIVRPIGNLSSAASVLESFAKMVEACNDSTVSVDKFLSRVDNSNWMGLVLNALNVACLVAQVLHQDGCPVLVHGGKGVDTTLIVSSLVQVILNPDCRTVVGLQALIEREWLQAGYPFHSRHRQSCYTPASARLKTSGSAFALFLDCVFQIHSQFSLSFEFTTDYLVLLFDHSYCSQFGTFLCDSERDRAAAQVQKRTTSLWSYLNRPEVLTTLLNPMYDPNNQVIWPTVAPISLVIWKQLFLRFVMDDLKPNDRLAEGYGMMAKEKELRITAVRLRKQLHELVNTYRRELQSPPV